MNVHCVSCGRPMEDVKKTTQNPEMKYCSKKCRAEKWDKNDSKLEEYLLEKLADLGPSNICPSQVSRDFFGEDWRSEHQRTVKACRRLSLKGSLLITQNKKAVKSLNFKGPIRISGPR